ncbi:DUF2147 domain-containing protein [Hoeflea poritis]|uniref:DUF2147 domain-containing protein n=1 Tax=Hoeflea poritis TaxID=2993659 RepID=A0ABT4VVR4_9HYPH|nr:DUF2147 domain-containing protein [Hoeflea poritis]MDA4848107.1 DUF2147 domain-containing protein [Hoeflea poritis]
MLKQSAAAVFLLVALTVTTFAADPIVGDWRTQSGETAAIAPCGGGNFCVTLKTGTYAGTKIGTLANTGGRYKGKITDPATNKTYTGKASISGTQMKMQGCVLGGLICQAQTWIRK